MEFACLPSHAWLNDVAAYESKASEQAEAYGSNYFSQIKVFVTPRPQLLFLVHASNHWLAFQIDFKVKSIAYGDSFCPSPGAHLSHNEETPTVAQDRIWERI
ncbi:hypothetical protein M422DRAFT_274861 [Sphaerobolus stellatus SS14]|uniref:Unplaced genomic scaffold SPHSTscaffold_421, whole genome shotgun sequence n=1 Tax=Sphaerobolus stellatus (strain SS14) TaxID=990650 RepID=A0A0C9UG05_SPHS4|nr:hypothetical protein M422DRAFT_274861 [Sphaerobolus stellatus SS14]